MRARCRYLQARRLPRGCRRDRRGPFLKPRGPGRDCRTMTTNATAGRRITSRLTIHHLTLTIFGRPIADAVSHAMTVLAARKRLSANIATLPTQMAMP